MIEVDEFEGKNPEIDRLRRLIYQINPECDKSESVYYRIEGIENSQEVSLRHIHNILNGFRYLNSINLSSFKYAEYARAIEITDKIELSLDALLKSVDISEESKDDIIATLNTVKLQNAPGFFQSTVNRLDVKVDAVIQHMNHQTNIDLSKAASIKPSFIEGIIKRFIKFIDSKRTKGPKEPEIYNRNDSIGDSYKKYKQEEDERKAAEAAKKAAEEQQKSPLRENVQTVIVKAKRGLHAISEALHLGSSKEDTPKAEQLQSLQEINPEHRDLSTVIPKSIARKKKANVDKAAVIEARNLKREAKLKRKEEAKKKKVRSTKQAKEPELIPAESTNENAEQLITLKKMGNLKKEDLPEPAQQPTIEATSKAAQAISEPMTLPKDKEEKVRVKVKLEKSPGKTDLKKQALTTDKTRTPTPKPKLERSPGAKNLREGEADQETVSEKKAGFFAKDESKKKKEPLGKSLNAKTGGKK